jgi:uncharacterized protein YyaL (SSP411 family)
VWPGRDDKVLTAWNAMMLHTFAEAGRVLQRDDWVALAARNAGFLLRELRPQGRLLRSWKMGSARIPAFLEDHALLADALLELYQASGDPRWLGEARAIAGEMVERFWDSELGAFFDTARDAEPLVVRPRDLYDGATPAGNSAAVMALLRLAELTGEGSLRAIAERALEGVVELAGRIPFGFGHLLCALDQALATPVEVAVVGDPADPATRALLGEASRPWLPHLVLARSHPAASAPAEAPAAGEAASASPIIPLLEGRVARDGRPTAYVCERLSCREPVTDPAALATQLAALRPPPGPA